MVIGGCFVLSGCAILSKAIYMLVIDNESNTVGNDTSLGNYNLHRINNKILDCHSSSARLFLT